MDQALEKILQETKLLFEEKKYKELIALLSDDQLTAFSNADLYSYKARACEKLGEWEDCLNYSQKAIDINPSMLQAYITRGNSLFSKAEFAKAAEDYSKAIQLGGENKVAYYNRGLVHHRLKEYAKAVEDFNESIALDKDYALAYGDRGLAWYWLNEDEKAMADYNTALKLDKNRSITYNNRAIIFAKQKKYDEAIADYTTALQLDPQYADAYYNRGILWYEMNKYDKALEDYNKVIQLNERYANAYYARALLYEKAKYEEAIKDFSKYVELTNNAEEYYTRVAVSKIEELKKKNDNAWYDEIDQLVKKVMKLLLFDKPCLTHYTSLSGAKALILKKSLFRLSEGSFLNDTSEGRELFKFISFEIGKSSNDDTIAQPFIEKPFIGSFVADNKHDDLTLWRMYGKEAQAEAKGCALTIYKDEFVNSLRAKINQAVGKTDSATSAGGQFTFYKVAYRDKDSFIIPGSSEQDQKQLNEHMQTLKASVSILDETQRASVAKLLNTIAYLFKSGEYQFEYETRLVVQGAGFKKEIDLTNTTPKVYIELVDITPVLHKITFGPKVERADEWAAAFNYQVKEENPQRKEPVQIVISHLPFK